MKLCSICGKFTKAGGLCYEHSQAMFIYNEEQKWRLEDEENKEAARCPS